MKRFSFFFRFLPALALALPLTTQRSAACTGITLTAADGTHVLARTIEWAGSDLNSRYVVVPRGHHQQSLVPGGTDGMSFTSRYGYVGLAVEQKEFIAEGLNEAGLSAGLFYFPGYGQYEEYDAAAKDKSIADLQLVAWLLGQCSTVDEVKTAVSGVHVVAVDPRASTVHWRFCDRSGRQVVLEITDGRPRFFENELGVLTNAPGFEWQLTNLNNYVNLHPGNATPQRLGVRQLAAFGAGSGFLGLPGDVTPPSRFVRAAFVQASAPRQATGEDAVRQAFQLLNGFDIPTGIEFAQGEDVPAIPSGTQWTSATDLTNLRLYYRTMYNSAIRCIDLRSIKFDRVGYQDLPLDNVKRQPIISVDID